MLSSQLLKTIREGKCIPIIGAGFSLNAKLGGDTMPTWNEFTGKLAEQLSVHEKNPLTVSQKFEDEYDRTALIQTLEESLFKDVVKPGLVHTALIRIPYFNTIFTTNYDNLLEDACKFEGRSVKVIVEKQQLASYGNDQDLKILKINGDLDHPNELIITKNDYDSYSTSKKQFEIVLAHSLITNTPLFIGFSLEDPNFLQIKKYVDSVMGKAVRKGYVILFDPSETDVESYEEMKLNVISIKTNGKKKSDCLIELFENISDQPIGAKDVIVVISANKTVLYKNQILQIETIIPDNLEQIIQFKIENNSGALIWESDSNQSNVIDKNLLENEVRLTGDKWKEDENYKIIANYNGVETYDFFNLSNAPEIMIQSDKTEYVYGSEIILTAIVPQAAKDTFIHYKIVNESKEILTNGNILVNSEDTGIYQSIVKLEAEQWKIRGAEFNIIIDYDGKSDICEIYTSNFGASISLDQSVYTWTDKVYLTIVAPDFNRSSEKINIIGNDMEGLLTIETSIGKISKYQLFETGYDTGIFTGEITLSGHISKNNKPEYRKKYPYGITRGMGPSDGFIGCLSDDTLTVTFQSPYQDTIVKKSIIRWNIGEIQWMKPSYQIGEYATVRVIDPDMSLNPNEIDMFDIHISSGSDKNGMSITVFETGVATGIFEGTVYFTSERSSEGGFLHVKQSDDVTATYVDHTLPSPYSDEDDLEITSITKILVSGEKLIPPLDRVKIKKVWITEGNLIHGKKIRLRLSNNQKHDQPYTVLLQIKDVNGVTVYGPISKPGILKILDDEINFELPKGNKNTKATLFVWESTDNPSALTLPFEYDL